MIGVYTGSLVYMLSLVKKKKKKRECVCMHLYLCECMGLCEYKVGRYMVYVKMYV